MKKSCFCVLAAVLLAFMAKADTAMTYSGNLPGTSEDSVLFENAHLLAVTGISLDIRNYFGGALKNLTLSNIVADDAGVDGIYHYSNDGSTLEAHFEWKNYGYNFGLLLILTQSGNDIRGRVTKVCYPGGAYGTDLNKQSSGSCRYFTNESDQDAYKSSGTFSTSCKNLTLTFTATESHTVLDINKLIADTVEYTTRADWTKGWTPVEAITPTDAMMVGLRDKLYTFSENTGDTGSVTWNQDSGLKIIDGVLTEDDGTYLGVIDFEDEFWDKLVQQITLDEAIQFIQQAGDDFENLDSIQLAKTYANDGPLGYTGDQVGGYFVRWAESDKGVNPYYTAESDDKASYRMATMPTEPLVAATFNKALVEREGELLGEDGLYSKESSLFAPGLNLHRTAYCARNHEYYSEDSVLTAYMGNAMCIGQKAKGTMAEPKHFAFNHQESNRSGLSTFLTEQAARENELRGFQMSMANNNAQGIMTAFNRAGTAYDGAYRNLLANVARGEWGYKGWFVTDMINGADYMNWRDIVAGAGGGALTTSAYDTSAIGAMANAKADIEKDVWFQEQMQQGIKYYLYNLAQSNAMNGISSTTEIVYIATWYENALKYATYALAALTALFLVLAVVGDLKSRKQ